MRPGKPALSNWQRMAAQMRQRPKRLTGNVQHTGSWRRLGQLDELGHQLGMEVVVLLEAEASVKLLGYPPFIVMFQSLWYRVCPTRLRLQQEHSTFAEQAHQV